MINWIRDIIEAFRTKESLRGFAAGLWISIAVLSSVSWLGAIEIRTPSETYWAPVSSKEHILGVPSWQNPEYKLYITSIGQHAGSINITLEKVNGWSFSGTFFIGDTITMGNLRVIIKEINLDRERPIRLDYYNLLDIKTPLLILLVLLTAGILLLSVPKRKRRRGKRLS